MATAAEVEIVIPFRGGCPHREAALERVLGLYAEHYPDWPVTVAECPSGPWVKALAVMPAVEASRASTVVVVDADVWCGPALGEAVERIGEYRWAVPHRQVLRLTPEATQAALTTDVTPMEFEQEPYKGVVGGGCVVARRHTVVDVLMDSRFENWGQEDQAWGLALTELAGPPWRGTGPLIHLWHPPQERMSRRDGSWGSKQLLGRYQAARGDPARMRAVIEQARAAWQKYASSSTMPASARS